MRRSNSNRVILLLLAQNKKLKQMSGSRKLLTSNGHLMRYLFMIQSMKSGST